MKKPKVEIVQQPKSLVPLLIGIIIILFLSIVIASYQLAQYSNQIAHNHMVPKGYTAVYRSIDDSSVVIVLDSSNPVHAQLIKLADQYIRGTQ